MSEWRKSLFVAAVGLLSPAFITTKTTRMELYIGDTINSTIVKVVVIFLKNNKENKSLIIEHISFKPAHFKDLPEHILKQNPKSEVPFLVVKNNEKVIVGQKEIINFLLASDPNISTFLISNKEEVFYSKFFSIFSRFFFQLKLLLLC